MNRFKMSFNNNGLVRQFPQNNISSNISSSPSNSLSLTSNNVNRSLHSPMIGRIYNAKPGCSSCGKKIA
jgi:hypothetical protein